MNPKVTKVQAEEGYMLNLWFSNGEQRHFDMKPYPDFDVFRALKDQKLFNTATTFLGSVTWSNNSDLSYDTLYLEGIPLPLVS